MSGGAQPIEVMHVTMPFGVQRSTLMTVAQCISDVVEADGEKTGAILSDNRGLSFNASLVRYVDYTTVCPRQWFTRRELALDVVSGAIGLTRPHYGHLMDPAIEVVAEVKPRCVLVYAGHYAAATLPRWEKVRGHTDVILYVHNPLSRTYGRRELRRLLDHADKVAFAGNHLLRSTEKRLGHSDPRLIAAPNGVNPLFWADRDRARSPEVFEVLYAGRIWPNKGVHLMLEAVERAASLTSRRLTVRIVGSADYSQQSGLTPYEESLRRSAAGMSVPVEFETFVDHVTLRQYLCNAAVACLPSISAEARPLAALEAMATGLPVITSDEPGMVEAVGAAGIVVPGGDPEGMAQAIAALADDERTWLTRSIRSRALARESRWESVADVLLSEWRPRSG